MNNPYENNIAYQSEINPKHKLIIDDIIQIKVNNPQIKMSIVKTQKLMNSVSNIQIKN